MEISINELSNIVNPYIIDIRSNQKYNDNHIPGAINISYDLLINDYNKYLDKNITYYLYCQKGVTSKLASDILNARGYKTFSILGGYESYILKK